jgi:hypothetical protein
VKNQPLKKHFVKFWGFKTPAIQRGSFSKKNNFAQFFHVSFLITSHIIAKKYYNKLPLNKF